MKQVKTSRVAAAYWIFAAWTGAIAVSAVSHLHQNNAEAVATAEAFAGSHLEKEYAIQSWASANSPIYIPSKNTRPNQHLSEMPGRDISVPGVGPLTVVNPASVLRMIGKEAEESGIRGRIVSTHPISQDNFADPWETSAIKSFSSGIASSKTVGIISGVESFRMAKPLMHSKSCNLCHIRDKIEEGSVHGAISISVPMEPFLRTADERNALDAITHFLVWLAASLAGFFMFRKMTAETDEKMRAISESVVGNQVFEGVDTAIFIADKNWSIIRVNKRFAAITGFSQSEACGRTPSIIRSKRHSPEFYSQIDQALVSTGKWRGEIWNERKDGEGFASMVSIGKTPDLEGGGYICSFSDITDSLSERDDIVRMANYDSLTNLPNRSLFMDMLTRAIERHGRFSSKMAVMVIKVNNLKRVNEVFGYASGDALLIEMATRSASRIRRSDTLARIGANSFGVIAESETGEHRPELLASGLIGALDLPISVNGIETFPSVSIGISVFPSDGSLAEELLLHADSAASQAVSTSGASSVVAFYNQRTSESAQRRMSMEADLRRGFENGEMHVFMQPQVNIGPNGEISIGGAEGLLRWIKPDGKIIPPMEFIPLAEETGIIIPIGSLVLRVCARTAAEIYASTGRVVKIAANISAKQLAMTGFAKEVIDTAFEFNLPKGALEIEVTESAFMDNMDEAVIALKSIRRAGISVALDDFGTGYSSLSYLRNLPADRLKIDKSFVNDVNADSNARAIVTTIAFMARNMGLSITAEGVEDASQAAFLCGLDIDEIQGYWISKPAPIKDFKLLFERSLFDPKSSDHAFFKKTAEFNHASRAILSHDKSSAAESASGLPADPSKTDDGRK